MIQIEEWGSFKLYKTQGARALQKLLVEHLKGLISRGTSAPGSSSESALRADSRIRSQDRGRRGARPARREEGEYIDVFNRRATRQGGMDRSPNPEVIFESALSALNRPVRVVVPSDSLRVHLSKLIVERLGAVAGVRVQTLHSLANEVVKAAEFENVVGAGEDGEYATHGGALPLLVERCVRESEMGKYFADLENPYGKLVATIHDLLDAGFTDAQSDAVKEQLAEINKDGKGRDYSEDGKEKEGAGGAGMGAMGSEEEKAQAIVNIADKVLRLARESGLRLGQELQAHARRLLEENEPERICPTRCTLVYGFSDATGEVTELLRAVIKRLSGSVYLDLPASPERVLSKSALEGEGGFDSGLGFPARFVERLSDLLTPVDVPVEKLLPNSKSISSSFGAKDVSLFFASSHAAEIREVARRIRVLLDKGSGGDPPPPESIGVVARGLEPSCFDLRREFTRMGVPFSGMSNCGPNTVESRREAAVSQLLSEESGASVETWLSAFPLSLVSGDHNPESMVVAPPEGEMAPWLISDILTAMRAQGAFRLAHVASFKIDDFTLDNKGTGVLLPTRGVLRDSGFSSKGADKGRGEDSGSGRVKSFSGRRVVAKDVMEWVLKKAAELVAFFESLPPSAPFLNWMKNLEVLLAAHLGWEREDVDFVLTALYRHLPLDFEIDFAELGSLYAGWVSSNISGPLGGVGGGVQVLSVTEARGYTFEHLFLVGMNRGGFPRKVTVDPLISDSVRGKMRVLLPDIPIKSLGYEEERYLFSQLVSSSPNLTLSYCTHDRDGKVCTPSLFVEQLRLARIAEPVCISDAEEGRLHKFRPAFEYGVNAGLTGNRKVAGAWLQKAVEQERRLLPLLVKRIGRESSLFATEERCGESGNAEGEVMGNTGSEVMASLTDSKKLIKGRINVLAEHDPDWSEPAGWALRRKLGPYFGFISSKRKAADGRSGRIFVTTLEKTAKCPWQTFLTRLLRIEPITDPMGSLPDVDLLVLGNVVHGVLSHIVQPKDQATGELRHVIQGPGLAPPWPDEETLFELALQTAEDVLKTSGVNISGLAKVAAVQSMDYLERCRELMWDPTTGPPRVLGAEVEGVTVFSRPKKGEQRVYFRADRVDRLDDGLLLIDYKTGKEISSNKRPSTRQNDFLKEVKAGTLLQAQAYENAALPNDSQKCRKLGRYVFLKPEVSNEGAFVDSGEREKEFKEAFYESVSNLLDLWEEGSFFPRLVKSSTGKEFSGCSYCDVSEACLRGDSGSRQRLKAWIQDAKSREMSSLLLSEAAILKVWNMGEKK